MTQGRAFRWDRLVWYCKTERILEPFELAMAIANWHRDGDWRRRSRRQPRTLK